MCGICGIIDQSKSLPLEARKELVIAMNKRLVHRGPDAEGIYSDKKFTIAMRRLSIVDTEGGNQPIFNETKDICIVFNGEIYNFEELRNRLIENGHTLKTSTDTEVLVHLYEDYGTDMLLMLKGMFAFCICDIKKGIYFIARDRFGEKPLYYHYKNRIFSFSSEVKSILENKNIERKLNHEALPYYLRTSLVPDPMTLFQNIHGLNAGQFILISDSGLEINSYFKPDFSVKNKFKTQEEAIECIEPLLEKSVQRQTIGDVPIGAFLSGGIDSSSIVALLQRQSSEPIKTFNVKFEDQAYDESRIAKKVAQYYGTDHHEIFVPNLDFDEDIFWNIIDHIGLPFRDSSAIPTHLISKEISKYTKVALSGDGGDEVFGGYDLYQWYQKILRVRKVGRPILQLANTFVSAAQSLPITDQLSIIRKLKRGLDTSLMHLEDIPIALNEMFSGNQIQKLLNHSRYSSEYPLLKKYPEGSQHWSDLRMIMYYRLKNTLASNMLIKVDRMSMANSLEVRAPFLDPDLFDASLRLPDEMLLNNGQGKYILRKIMAKFLPREVFDHPKTGFNIPLYKYQNENFKRLAVSLLFEDNPWPDFFPQKELEKIYHLGMNTKKDTAKHSVFQSAHHLWMIMQLLGWAKRFNVQT